MSSCPKDAPYFDAKGEINATPTARNSPSHPELTFSLAAMNVFSSTTSMVASALMFDICELWIRIRGESEALNSPFHFFCLHSLIASDLIRYSSSLQASSAFPSKERIISLSPTLCDEVLQLDDFGAILWRNGVEEFTNNTPRISECNKSFNDGAFGTAMAKFLCVDRGLEYFIVAYSLKKKGAFHENVTKFLKGLSYGMQLCSNFAPDDCSQSSVDGGSPIDSIEDDASYVHRSPSYKAFERLSNHSFPLKTIPITRMVPDDLNFFLDLKNVSHLTDGMSANIYFATFKSQKVIVKILKEDLRSDIVACQEFEMEYNLLLRLNHPHIVNILGAGRLPRSFMVLEYLEGDTLQQLLQPNDKVEMGLAQKLLHKRTFTHLELLRILRDLVSALAYLHSGIHPGLSVVHRDLKPDNIGFLQDGTIKIFDFGLCACIRRRSTANEAYDMTGNTGSLRYMAPEVALNNPYNELVDVYSFSIVAWQMAKDKVPFRNFDKSKLMNEVVLKGQRPKMDEKWSVAFKMLLSSCWDNDFMSRPPFMSVHMQLEKMLEREEDRVKLSWTKGIVRRSSFSSNNCHSNSISMSSSSKGIGRGKEPVAIKTTVSSSEIYEYKKPPSPIKRVMPEARDSSWF